MNKEFKKRLLSSIILIPVSFFLIIKGSIFFIFFLSILFLATSYEWVKMSKKNILLKFFGIVFLFFSFYTAFEIRGDENFEDFLFIITICIFTDIGGFIFGKTFKGKKLSYISPNKTYAGVYGSFLLSFLIMFLLKNYIDLKFIIILLFTFSVCLLSQFGDLFFSLLKRMAKVKDTGKLLPGHGGILDRIDGLVISVPFNILVYHLAI